MIDFSKLKRSFRGAFEGLSHAFFRHQNLRIHLILGFGAILLGIILRISYLEWVAVLLAIFLVFATEMINTALEEIIDLVKENHSQQAKVAKDVSAGMVLLAALFSLIVGVLVFLPKLFP